MLEKDMSVEKNYTPGTIVFRNIQPNQVGEGLCYVRDGKHKISKAEKPFITLYLQDIEGAVIPGYLFDLADFKKAGLELTAVIHNLVQIKYEENYIPKYGLSVRIISLAKVNVTSAESELLSRFIGSTQSATADRDELNKLFQKKLNLGISVPQNICTLWNIDYEGGSYGGIVRHYLRLFYQLQAIENKFTPDQARQLYATLALYIFAHLNYLAAEKRDEADITLLATMMTMTQTYAEKLHLGAHAPEVVAVFFGCEPKSIYVRLIRQFSEALIRADREINLWRTLPLSREGNAGYGIIKQYKEGT